MKIGVLGSGAVGQSMAAGLVAIGHEVAIAGRTPNERTDAFAAAHPGAHSRSFADAAAWAEALVLATAWYGTEAAIAAAGPAALAGKPLLDLTNPLRYVDGRPRGLALGFDDSGGEAVQRWAPGAFVVKAFNTVGHEMFHRPAFASGVIPEMYYCGNESPGKAFAATTIAQFGWDPVDVGDITAARLLEPFAMLWVTLAVRGKARNAALTRAHGATFGG
jgi:predicted dinucleotide-binding enzyme